MSLVGSLADLSLGDILQILSLSQKSGVLALETTGCTGRIVFVEGMVRGAMVKDGPRDLRGVLVAGGFVSDDDWRAAAAHAAERGCEVRSALDELGVLEAERVESLCREAVESAVMTMFRWPEGDFSFDVCSELGPEDPELLSRDGLNPQYLVMESARVGDEGGADDEAENARYDDMPADEMFGVTSDDTSGPDADAVDVLAGTGVEALLDPVVPTEVEGELQEPARALIVIDRDLVALEWVKAAARGDYEPIHVFQQTDPAMTRIRQYLLRGEPPVVLIEAGTPVDRLGGFVDAFDFVARLKAQSPRIVVLWLGEEGSPPINRMGTADGVVTRPDKSRLRIIRGSEDEAGPAADFARDLRDSVSGAAREEQNRPPAGGGIAPAVLHRLRDATKALTEASSRGEVLPLVVRFAAGIFGRVAMFLVRDGSVVGVAQSGLERCGGPDDAELRDLAYPCDASPWLTRVLDRGKAIRGAPDNDGDRDFAGLLGDRVPAQAYLAPLESTGRVIAVLYADNLPGDAPVGDTSVLEVVLHHAGLALDRAALERALRENEAPGA